MLTGKLRWLPLAFCLLSLTAQAQESRLEPGQTVEREIRGGESHIYQIQLAAGQFARLRLEQRAIDAALILTAPDGKQMVEMNLTRVGEEDSFSLEVAAAGSYQLTVRGNGGAALRGSYRLDATVQATATAQDGKRLTAEALMVEASELRKQRGKTEQQVIEKLQQALSLWRELKEPTWIAYSLYYIGYAYDDLSQSEKAIEYCEQALAISREFKLRGREGIALNTLGVIYNSVSQYEKAIKYFEQALFIRREIKDRVGEGNTLVSLGAAYGWMSRYEKAIEYFEQALTISREVKDRVREGYALNNLSVAHNSMGRYEKAIEYCEQALAISREVKDRDGEGDMLNNLCVAHNSVSQHGKAIEYCEQALFIRREIKDRMGEGHTLNNLGAAYRSLGRYEKAIKYFEQALFIRREIKDRAGEGATLISSGSAYRSLGQYEKAIEYYEQALEIAREVKNLEHELFALSNLARTESERGQLALARSRSEESLRVAESLRTDLVSAESRAAFLASVQSSYQLYTDLLMQQHRAEPTKGLDALAVEVSERQRARSLLDLLTEARADLRQGVAPALIERERLLAKQLNDKAQELTQAAKPDQAAALKQEISQLETDLERAQVAIRKANPRYAALTQPQPLKLKEIQHQLDADTLLLEYSLGQQRSYLWAITRDSLVSYELPKGEVINQSALAVYEMLTARSMIKRGESAVERVRRITQAEANMPAAAQSLSQTLLAPVTSQLGNKRLVIVADGALQYIPFAMLPDPVAGKNQPIIVNHEVVSLPSASALAIQRAELAGRQRAPKMLAVIADPVFDRSDDRLKSVAIEASNNAQTQTIAFDDARSIEHLAVLSTDRPGTATHRLIIPRLPFTRQEATRLLALAPKDSSFGAIDFQASRATVLKGDLSQYRYVHFATHGLLDSERPGLSSMVLSMVDEKGQQQDGFLRANDIYNLKLPAELIVLSACQTGLGKEIKGEGLVGLTRGFMYAGAARVVVSLWNVNDRATAELMTKFYEKMLKQGNRPAAALRAAQVEMWKQKAWQAPYYWAAFTLQGEWR
jgi:CHAT domain-containing protein/Tfp pilus assembly protein PilF